MKASWIFTVLTFTVLTIDAVWLWPIFGSEEMTATSAALWWRVGLAAAPLGLLAALYYSLVKPVNAVVNGMDLLRGQDFSTRLAHVGQRDADTLVGVFNSMMDRLKAERLRVMEQNNFLKQLIEVSPMGVAILDFDGRVIEMNRSMAEALGFGRPAEAVCRSFEEMSSPLAHAIAGVEQGSTDTLRMGDSNVLRCSKLWFMDNGFRRTFVLLEELTDEVMRAEREAYGKVIRIISHEVNNTLTGVNSILGLVSGMPAVSSDSMMAEAVESCQERCTGLGKFISSYAEVVKIPEARLQPVDLAETLRSMWRFLEGMAPAGLEMELRCDGPLPVMADAVLLEQVMVNVVKNAIESIGSRQGGRVTVSACGHPVRVEVADNGAGVSREVSRRLFTPFFSTKPGGRGLGLMFVSDILEKHRCRFSLRTDPDGALTRFSVEFPR